jgi:hypothetical protein
MEQPYKVILPYGGVFVYVHSAQNACFDIAALVHLCKSCPGLQITFVDGLLYTEFALFFSVRKNQVWWNCFPDRVASMIVNYGKYNTWVTIEEKSSSMPIMARSDLIKEQRSTGEERWLKKAGLGKRWRVLRVYNTGASQNWCTGARDGGFHGG